MTSKFLSWLTKVFGGSQIPLIESSYFYVDYWTMIHFFSGVFLMVLIIKTMKGFDWRRKFTIFFIVLAFWEIFEGNFKGIAAEKTVDIIYDFIMGMAGGILIYFYYYNSKIS